MTRVFVLAALALAGVGSLSEAGGILRGRSSSCGSYYPTYSYYQPSYYYPSYSYQQPTYTAPAAPSYSTNWKAEAMAFAKSKDDQLAFFAAMKALGVNGQVYDYGYGGGAVQQGYANVATGSTLYGYTYQQIQQAYGQTDMNVLNQQVARNVQGAQQLASDALVKQVEFAAQLGDNQARVAEILARASAAAQVLKATEPQASTTTTTTIQGNGYAGGGGAVQQSHPGDEMLSFKTACGACHSGNGANVKVFDIGQLRNLTQAQKAVVWERLTTTDLSKRMPREVGNPSKPGKALSGEELMKFAKHLQ